MFTAMQVILITAFMFVLSLIGMSVQLFAYGAAVFQGFVTGLIMGDVQIGLTVGGTLCLMGLGIGGYGGSSVPDYQLGTVIGTAFAIATNGGIESGLAVGIPVAALGVQLDVLAKMSGSFFFHKQVAAAEKADWTAMGNWVWAWNYFRALLYTLPVLLVLTVGSQLIVDLLAAIPDWLTRGLSVASGLLPALGMAILLKYMPVKKYGVFLIFGFALSSYLGLPMMGIAALAFVAAYMIYQGLQEKSSAPAGVGHVARSDEDE